MKVLACGGRKFDERNIVFRTLDALHEQRRVTLLVEGGARGADWHAYSWAKERKVPFITFPADWEKHGRKAGPIRNQQMLDEVRPDLVIAFPGGSGTADMVSRARKAGVAVFTVERD